MCMHVCCIYMYVCMHVYCAYMCIVCVCVLYIHVYYVYMFLYMCVVSEISHSFLSKIIRLEKLLIIWVVVA